MKLRDELEKFSNCFGAKIPILIKAKLIASEKWNTVFLPFIQTLLI
jgi:hypothetical protein